MAISIKYVLGTSIGLTNARREEKWLDDSGHLCRYKNRPKHSNSQWKKSLLEIRAVAELADINKKKLFNRFYIKL